jgi:predicted phosphodiesterase
MRVAVISDIHGNCLALEAVLADLRQRAIDQVVCLGDAIQGGAQPAETVALLRELTCPVVMGNADAWLLSGVDTSPNETTTQQQQDVRQWSLSQLSPEDAQFIERFQPTIEVALEGGQRLLCFHGSPRSFDDLIFPETPFQTWLGPYAPAIMTGGHTHLQQIRRLDKTFFFNPGSVGLAYNRQQPADHFQRDPWAEYAILTSEGKHAALEFRRVPLDVDKLIHIYQASGRPHSETAIAEYERGR